MDDYLDSDIQADVHFKESENGAKLTAEVDFALSVTELRELVASGKAYYAVVFACRDTYFRRAAISSESNFTETFPVGALRGQVLINPYIVAAEDIDGFTCKWINPEFGPGPFRFPGGAALALDAPQAVFIDREAFKPLSSCFSLVKSDHVPPNEWQVLTERHKVQIAVSPGLKERIDAARNSKENRAILMNSIYFGAVMQCLSVLKQAEAEDPDDWRWQKVFHQRMENSGIDLEKHSESWIAQQLLRHPIATVDQYFFGEKGE
ncbi:hypothetical protein [Mesorhizobium sp.]|uniref:hypothetical protein n=1 Tax=Mesorhizobium sp. TaxID=1871066 RepID=UPI000FE7426D|nr:hypothetical protein [Mesorhizobium sp.]RWO60520.1 MAG: hypothetical protein EOS14_13545 [Mesorhizobium sp.]